MSDDTLTPIEYIKRIGEQLDRPTVELHPELMSLYGINPFIRHVSASRAAMFTGNLAQMVTMREPNRSTIRTGMEREFIKSTYCVEFPDDIEIIAVLPRFAHTAGANRIPYSPQTAVIYENYRTGEVGVTMLVDYHVSHQHFGMQFKRNREVIEQLRRGARFPKGTRLAQSPNISEDGDYTYGRMANVLLSSDVAGTEDGVMVRRGYLEKLAPLGIEKRVFEFGREFFPTNQSNVEGVYKCFPDIGDKVDSSGLVVSLRRYDVISAVANMTKEALRETDFIFDRKRFVSNTDAEVIDIKVERNTAINIPPVPVGMEDQLYKYYDADTEWYKKIIEVWTDLKKQAARRNATLRLEPAFSNLVFEAIGRVGGDYIRPDGGFNRRAIESNNKVDKFYYGVKLDAWRVEITFKYLSIPNKGYKITDINGNKAVVVEVRDDEDMPVDENGVVADIVADPNSRWNRVTPASPIEMVINAASRDLAKRMKTLFGFDLNEEITRDQAEEVVYAPGNKEIVDQVFAEMMEFYKVVVPFQYDALNSPEYQRNNPEYKYTHVVSVIHDHEHGVDLFMPTDNPVHIPDVIREIQKRWPPFITPVRFRGRDGKMKVSKQPMLIAPSLYINLEKTAEDSWMAAASTKYNVFGTTAKLNNNDKYENPGRNASQKTGESEFRAMAACIGGEELARRYDTSNNPIAHKFILRKIITHPTPGNIDEVLDRTVVPLGGHRPLTYIRHMFQCSGKEFTNELPPNTNE